MKVFGQLVLLGGGAAAYAGAATLAASAAGLSLSYLTALAAVGLWLAGLMCFHAVKELGDA